MPISNLPPLLAPNRAEELGYDVWKQFVLPPFYPTLGIGDTRKPKVIIGGRGCGKTMLLRYLSHESTFSPDRKDVPESALSHIGLYWRADTQFASLMQRRGLEDDTWAAAFRHLAALVLGIEILRSLQSISNSVLTDSARKERLSSITFRRLKPFSPDLPEQFNELHEFLEDSLARFESWVNDVRTIPQPRLFPGADFIRRMLEIIITEAPELRNAIFFVYIDEYENLATYQQRIINTWLKHSEPPLIFNFAMKRNGFKTRYTEGEEALSDIHDYRDIDIEKFDREDDFPIFAAEILSLRLGLASSDLPEANSDWLRDASKLEERRDPKYTDLVQKRIRNIFPSLPHSQLASDVFADSLLVKRLRERVSNALEARNAKSEVSSSFVFEAFPEASLVVPALLHRRSLSVSDIKEELQRLTSGQENRFTGSTNWTHNNFVACYLQLFDGLARPCPIYSGFSTFCYMSRGNLRHFLELSFRALQKSADARAAFIRVGTDVQAEAARQVSSDLLAEVRSFGPQGNNLYTFVLRLGSLFALSQQQPTQSEPERTHFSIQGGEAEISAKEAAFLAEAIKWSVLFQEKGTKKKSTSDLEGTEYVLNPIYSPYFHISYRKKRKLELSASEATTLISGSYELVRGLLGNFQRRWGVDTGDSSLPLFAHLFEGDTK